MTLLTAVMKLSLQLMEDKDKMNDKVSQVQLEGKKKILITTAKIIKEQ